MVRNASLCGGINQKKITCFVEEFEPLDRETGYERKQQRESSNWKEILKCRRQAYEQKAKRNDAISYR